jgi:hypothetical protein
MHLKSEVWRLSAATSSGLDHKSILTRLIARREFTAFSHHETPIYLSPDVHYIVKKPEAKYRLHGGIILLFYILHRHTWKVGAYSCKVRHHTPLQDAVLNGSSVIFTTRFSVRYVGITLYMELICAGLD